MTGSAVQTDPWDRLDALDDTILAEERELERLKAGSRGPGAQLEEARTALSDYYRNLTVDPDREDKGLEAQLKEQLRELQDRLVTVPNAGGVDELRDLRFEAELQGAQQRIENARHAHRAFHLDNWDELRSVLEAQAPALRDKLQATHDGYQAAKGEYRELLERWQVVLGQDEELPIELGKLRSGPVRFPLPVAVQPSPDELERKRHAAWLDGMHWTDRARVERDNPQAVRSPRQR